MVEKNAGTSFWIEITRGKSMKIMCFVGICQDSIPIWFAKQFFNPPWHVPPRSSK